MRSLVYLLLLVACLGLTFCYPPEKEEPWKIDCTRYTPITDTVNGIYLIDTVMSDGVLQTNFVRKVTFAGNDTFLIRNRKLTDCGFFVRDFNITNGRIPYPRQNMIHMGGIDPLNYDVYVDWQGGISVYQPLDNIMNANDTIFLFKRCSCYDDYQYFYATFKVLRRGKPGSFKLVIYVDENNYMSFRQI